MKTFAIFVLSILSFSAKGQISGWVIDSSNNQPIPYLNIWVEKENIGTTSVTDGNFLMKSEHGNKTIVFSAIGFEIKKISTQNMGDTVFLRPSITQLTEVTVQPRLFEKEVELGPFKKKDSKGYHWSWDKPFMIARRFRFSDSLLETPHLKTIKVLTRNYGNKEATFNLRLYYPDEEGKPGSPLHNQNILVTGTKRKKIVEIDVSDLKLTFPKEGLFVAVEWLIIDGNKYEYVAIESETGKKSNEIAYEPALGLIEKDDPIGFYHYHEGEWRIYKSDFNYTPAISLVLTN